MKLSFSSPFTRLTFAAMLATFAATVAGRLVTLCRAAADCVGWPLCAPVDRLGWLALGHQWVRERGYLSLPVVAIGSIPYIYRRAAFPHRASPVALP